MGVFDYDRERSGEAMPGAHCRCEHLKVCRQLVCELIGSSSTIERHPLPEDDPTRRKPDITRARELLGWNPQVELQDGLARTIEWHMVTMQEIRAS